MRFSGDHEYQADGFRRLTTETWTSAYVIWTMAAGKTALIHSYLCWLFQERRTQTHAVILTPTQVVRDGFVTSTLDAFRRTFEIGGVTLTAPEDMVQAAETDVIESIHAYLRVPNPGYALVVCNAAAKHITNFPEDMRHILIVGDELQDHGAEALGNLMEAFRSRNAPTICVSGTPYRQDGTEVLPPRDTPGVLFLYRSHAEQIEAGLAPTVDFSFVPVNCTGLTAEERLRQLSRAVVADWREGQKAAIQITPRKGYWPEGYLEGEPLDEPSTQQQETVGRLLRDYLLESFDELHPELRIGDMTSYDPIDPARTPNSSPTKNYRQLVLNERAATSFRDSQLDALIGIQNISAGLDNPMCNTSIALDFLESLPRTVQFMGRSLRSKHCIDDYPTAYRNVSCYRIYVPVGPENEGVVREELAKQALLVSFVIAFTILPEGLRAYTKIRNRIRQIDLPNVAVELDRQRSHTHEIARTLLNYRLLTYNEQRLTIAEIRPLLTQSRINDGLPPEEAALQAEQTLGTLIASQGSPELQAKIDAALEHLEEQESPHATVRHAYELLTHEFDNDYISVRMNPSPLLNYAIERFVHLTARQSRELLSRFEYQQHNPLVPAAVARWARVYANRFGRLPETGPVGDDAPDERWETIIRALRAGYRGLPRHPSLADFCRQDGQLLILFNDCYYGLFDPAQVLAAYDTVGDTNGLARRYDQYHRARRSAERAIGGHAAQDAIEYVAKHVGLANFLQLFRTSRNVPTIFWRGLSQRWRGTQPVTMVEVRELLRSSRSPQAAE